MTRHDVRPLPTTLLRVLVALAMATGVAACVAGLLLVLDDTRTDTDMFDGLGTALGLFLFGGAAVALVVLGVLLRLLRRRPRTGLWLAALLGGLGLLTTPLFAAPQVTASQGSAQWWLVTAYGAASLLVLGLAAWGLLPRSAGPSEGSDHR